jgi:hypothetical protein
LREKKTSESSNFLLVNEELSRKIEQNSDLLVNRKDRPIIRKSGKSSQKIDSKAETYFLLVMKVRKFLVKNY